MSQKKKVAVAYLLAVPVALAIVYYQHVALSNASGSFAELSEAADVIRGTDDIFALIREAQTAAQKCIESNGKSADFGAYRDSVAHLQKALQKIGEQTKDEQSAQASFRDMSDLVGKQVALLNHAVAAKGARTSPGEKSSDLAMGQESIARLVKDRAEINAIQRARLEHQGRISDLNLQKARRTNLFGGGLLIWFIAVAAFLLFHNERVRVWAGVERRVHTKVLQTLPIGVSVATDTGVIVFTNPAEDALFGYEKEELVGKSANLLHDLEGREAEPIVKAILTRLDSGEIWEGDLPVRKKDGTIHNIPSWIMNLEFPGKVYRVFVHREN